MRNNAVEIWGKMVPKEGVNEEENSNEEIDSCKDFVLIQTIYLCNI